LPGDDFTAYDGADSGSAETNISVSFTMASPLGADLDNFVTPLSFQIGDGFTTLTDQSSNIGNANTSFYFVTDDTGRIYLWTVSVFQTNGSGWLSLGTQTDSDDSVACGTGDLSQCFSDESFADVDYSQAGTQPGWTAETAAPEPSTIALATLGGLLLLASRIVKRPLTR